MAIQQTLFIIKPDATRRNLTKIINDRLENAGLSIVAQKSICLTRAQSECFYKKFRNRTFFDSLIKYMTSAPVVVQILAGEDVIGKARELIGHTDPSEAAANTIRKDFGISIKANAVHSSDNFKSAQEEIAFFFPGYEFVSKVNA